MFLTETQFYVFVACTAFGGVCAAIYSFVDNLAKRIKIRTLREIISFLLFLIFAICFAVYSFRLRFPSFRFYQIGGVVFGAYVYYKSLYIILAKTIKKHYNKKKK